MAITKTTIEAKINKLIIYLKSNSIKETEAKALLRYVGFNNCEKNDIFNNYNGVSG